MPMTGRKYAFRPIHAREVYFCLRDAGVERAIGGASSRSLSRGVCYFKF